MNFAIFISGKASAGKDSFLNWLKETTYKFEYMDRPKVDKLAFADAVYKEFLRLHPEVDLHRLYTDYEYKAQFRKELVAIGDGYRQTNPSIWIDKHYEILKQWNSENNNAICCIPDVRYAKKEASEWDYSKEVSSLLPNLIAFRVRVKASLKTRLLRMSPAGARSYMQFACYNDSETSMDSIPDEAFDFVIENNTYAFNGQMPQQYRDVIQEFVEIYKHLKDK